MVDVINNIIEESYAQETLTTTTTRKLNHFKKKFHVRVGGLFVDLEAQQCLLVHQRCSGLYGIPKGKKNFHETLINALKREVRQETGIVLDQIHMTVLDVIHRHPFTFKNDHGFKEIVYCMGVKKADIKPHVLDKKEIDHIVWWDIHNLPKNMNSFSRFCIKKFLEQQQK